MTVKKKWMNIKFRWNTTINTEDSFLLWNLLFFFFLKKKSLWRQFLVHASRKFFSSLFKIPVWIFIYLFFPFFWLSWSMYSFWARDQTWVEVGSYAAAAQNAGSINLLCWAGDQTCVLELYILCWSHCATAKLHSLKCLKTYFLFYWEATCSIRVRVP